MKTCPECRNALVEKRGVYVYEPPHISAQPVVIPNASWSFCPICGYEIVPKALKKSIKRAYPRLDE
jgi:uncharacterized Zn finger protein (UPF0148 family)